MFELGVSGISLDFMATGIISISSAGLYVNLSVSLDASLTSLLTVSASGSLLIDTTHSPNLFELSLNGTLNIAGVLSINGSFNIDVGIGGPNTWRIAMSLSGSLGPITLSASGWVQSDGQFSITLSGSLYLGVSGFSISGGVTGTISLIKTEGQSYVYSPQDQYTFTISVGGYVTLDIIGIDFGVSLTLSGTAVQLCGSTTTLSLVASGSVTILGITFHKSATIATISIPSSIFSGSPPPYLGTPNTSNISGVNSSGNLALNVGPGSSGAPDDEERNGAQGQSGNYTYELTDLGGGQVQVVMINNITGTTYTETDSGVTSVTANLGTDSNVTLVLEPGFALPVYGASSGNDVTVVNYGSGAINWTASETSADTLAIIGGSGNTITVTGNGTNYIGGATGNNTITVGSGTNYILGQGGTFTFTDSSNSNDTGNLGQAFPLTSTSGYYLSSMTSTTGSVAGNDTISVSGTNYIIGGGGNDHITGGSADYIIADTGTLEFNSNGLTGVIAGPGLDTGTDTISGGNYIGAGD